MTTAPRWKSTQSTLANVDDSLHAGITKDVMRGNLWRAQQQSVIAYQGYSQSELSFSHTFSDTSTFEGIESWDYWIWPFRRWDDRTWRELTLRLRGKCSSTGNVTVRAYIVPRPLIITEHSSTTGLNWSAYGEFTFSTTSWAWASATINYDLWLAPYPAPANWTTRMPSNNPDIGFVQLMANSEGPATVYVDAPHWMETPPAETPDPPAPTIYTPAKSLQKWGGQMDGVNMSDVAAFDFLETDPFSLMCEFKQTPAGGSIQSLIAKYIPGSGRGYMLNHDLDNDRLQVILANDNAPAGTNAIDVQATGLGLDDDAFHHVVMTYDGSADASGVQLYVDGSNKTLTTNYNTLTDTMVNSSEFYLGRVDDGSRDFYGRMCNVAIWDDVLTSTEVGNLYTSDYAANSFDNNIGWWKLSDNIVLSTGVVADSSGSGNDGTVSDLDTAGNLIYNDYPGGDFTPSKSLNFDGSNDLVNYGTISELTMDPGSDAWSMSIWFKTTSTSTTERVLFGSGTWGAEASGFFAWLDHAGGTDYVYVRLRYSGESTETQEVYATMSEGLISDGQWHHVAVSYDGSNDASGISIWVDAKSQSTTTVTNETINLDVSGSVTIGGPNTKYFVGNLCEFYAHDSELSESDVQGLYACGIPLGNEAVEPPLVWSRCGTGDTYPTILNLGILGGTANGTMQNMTSTDLQSDVPDSYVSRFCLDFDASNDCVTLGDVHDKAYNDAFSISAWCVNDATSGRKSLMTKRDPAGNSRGWSLNLDTATMNWEFAIVDTVSPVKYFYCTFSSAMTTGVWKNVVMTYDGSGGCSGVKVYLDDSSLSRTSVTDLLSTGPTSTAIACIIGGRGSPAAPTTPWDGRIDEVAIWGTELTSAEVTSIYNSGVAGPLSSHAQAANMDGWWRMGDCDTFSTITDYGNDGNPGTMTNMVSTDIVADAPGRS